MNELSRKVGDIVSELRAQHWTLTLSHDGTKWRGIPPDPTRHVVQFSSRPSDLTLVLRHLRNQGFVWPPPFRAPPVEVVAIVKATPFPPKPHPEVDVSVEATIDLEDEPVSVVPSPVVRSEADDVFAELREAKGYEELAAIELKRANERMAAADRALRDASDTYQAALAVLREKKRAFDLAFSPEGAVE